MIPLKYTPFRDLLKSEFLQNCLGILFRNQVLPSKPFFTTYLKKTRSYVRIATLSNTFHRMSHPIPLLVWFSKQVRTMTLQQPQILNCWPGMNTVKITVKIILGNLSPTPDPDRAQVVGVYASVSNDLNSHWRLRIAGLDPWGRNKGKPTCIQTVLLWEIYQVCRRDEGPNGAF